MSEGGPRLEHLDCGRGLLFDLGLGGGHLVLPEGEVRARPALSRPKIRLQYVPET